MDPAEDEEWIEAEIQRQLSAITLPINGLLQIDDIDETVEQYEVGDDDADESHIPNSVQKYLDVVNQRSHGLQKDLQECEQLLNTNHSHSGEDDDDYQSNEMKELAFILGEDPVELRERVLAELDEEENKETEKRDTPRTSYLSATNQQLTPADNESLVMTETTQIEQEAWQKLIYLDEKLKQHDAELQEGIEYHMKQQQERDQLNDVNRQKKHRQYQEELKQMKQEQLKSQAVIEQELAKEIKKYQQVFDKEQAEIEAFAKKTEIERHEFELHLTADRQHKERQRRQAATLLQAVYRSYRVRRKYHSRLNRMKEERHERHLQNRQIEIIAMRRAEEQRKKKDKAQKKQREEDERRRKEELQRQEEEQRMNEEELQQERLEKERKRLRRLEQQILDKEHKQREQTSRQEMELEERTLEILSKIKEDGASQVTHVRNMDPKDTMQQSNEIFITNSEERSSTSDYPQTAITDANKQTYEVVGNVHDSQKQVTNTTFSAINNNTTVSAVDNNTTVPATDNNTTLSATCVDNNFTVSAIYKNATVSAINTNHQDTISTISNFQLEGADTSAIDSHQHKASTTVCSKVSLQQGVVSVTDSLQCTAISAMDSQQLGVNFQQSYHPDRDLNEERHSDTVGIIHVCKSTGHLQPPIHSSHAAESALYVCKTHDEQALPNRTETNFGEDVFSNTHSNEHNQCNRISEVSQAIDNPTVMILNPVNSDTNDVIPGIYMDVEARRVHWMQNCMSHSSLVDGLQCDEIRKTLRRYHAASKLPVLTPSQLLLTSLPTTPITQVQAVILRDIAGCSLSSLTSCTLLRCLHLQQCGIILLEGLQQSNSISFINLQHNKLEGIHCRDRTNLSQLVLSDNKLTSIHGIEGCTQLRYVQLANNSITRTDGLKSLVSITHLDLSFNQLVSINGLEQLVYLQDLNLAHNHLSTVHQLHTCCLLHKLNIESNCLIETPTLQNHVLLGELNLNDNSLTSIALLTEAWLPLLQHLSVAQNGLTNIPDMKYCIMLKTLDASLNCITDIDVVNGLQACYRLEELNLQGNPVIHEDNYRCNLEKRLPWLRVLDNDSVKESLPVEPIRKGYMMMCLSQIRARDHVYKTHDQYTQSFDWGQPSDILPASHVTTAYMEARLQQAIIHRRMHENNDMKDIQYTSQGSIEATFQQYISTQIKSGDCTTDPVTVLPSVEPNSVNNNISQTSHASTCNQVHVHDSYAHDVNHVQPAGSLQQTEIQQQEREAAIRIQARWRGYIVRRDLDNHAKLWLAALHIQAIWRGYRVRKRLATARQAAMYHDSDEDQEDEEIDPTSWDLAQENVDNDWFPSEAPSIPRIHPCVPGTQGQSNPQHQQGHQVPLQAWCEVDAIRHTTRSPHAMLKQLNSKPPIPPLYPNTASNTPRSARSHRQQHITAEWGFKDSTTAELMMKRAKKLSKGGTTYKKKKTLDPLQRYQQMKKVHPPERVLSSPKRSVQRQEFFTARQQEIDTVLTAQHQQKQHKHSRTFEWVHTHASDDVPSFQESGRHSNSEPNLPIMSPQALQGRVQLMGSPSLEIQSVDGTSSVGSLSHRPRSHSLSIQQANEQVHFPAIKTSSAPSGGSRGQKESRGWTSITDSQV